MRGLFVGIQLFDGFENTRDNVAGRLVPLFEQAGFPPGVVNILSGGPAAGAALVAHRGIDKISFTGGIQTARKIIASTADTLTPTVLELGGKGASVIFGDANLEAGAVWVEKDNDPYVSLGASRIKIDAPITPGSSRSLTFPLKVLKEVKQGGTLRPLTADRITLNVAAVEILPDEVDSRFRATVHATIEIPIGQPLKARRLIRPTILVGETQVDGTRVRLPFSISDVSDDTAVPPLDLVALFQGEDKIDMQMASALDGPVNGTWTYTPRVNLTPGLNQIRLLVRDSDGVVSDRLVRVWGPEAPAPAVAKPIPAVPELSP